ncbi:MAG: hypothetical protein AAFU67_14055, partial [Bacteroidota bacterium]
MLRYLISCVLLCAAWALHAQSEINNQSIPLNGAKLVRIYASLSDVELASSSGDQVEVQHILRVNGEDMPELQKLEIKREGEVLVITEVRPTAELMQK